MELPKPHSQKLRRFEINKDTIEYEKENLAMLYLVNTVVWRWDMDHNQSNEDTYRSILSYELIEEC